MVGERNKRWAVLIVIVLVVASLSGCLGSEKQDNNERIDGSINVSNEIDLAFQSLFIAGDFVDEAYRASREEDYDKTIELFKKAKKSYEKSHNHFSVLLNKTGDPRTDEFVYYYFEGTKFYVKASEAEIKYFEYRSIGDVENSETASDEAKVNYAKAREFLEKTREILEELNAEGKTI
ncbi:hypothetical protein BMS3Abin16_01496 [archaeon BMS3Abin16]|nr:hypothetical protein BMS3Abin16_01496 [archaeon BMS3Abin16]HDY73823.1 hypothetical protein [Euryarchaeota archaeon]